MEPKHLFPQTQVPATCPYPEPNRSGPYPHVPLAEDPSQYHSPISARVSKVFSFTRMSQQNHLYVSPQPHIATCHTQFIFPHIITRKLLGLVTEH